MTVELVVTLVIALMVVVYFVSKNKKAENQQVSKNEKEDENNTIEHYMDMKENADYKIQDIIANDTAEKYRSGDHVLLKEVYITRILRSADNLVMKKSKFAYNSAMKLYYTGYSIKQYEELFEGIKYVYIKPKEVYDKNEWHIYNRENESHKYEEMMNIAIEMNVWLR